MYLNIFSYQYKCVLKVCVLFLSAYTICSPMVRSDGSVSVSVRALCTKEEETKKCERLVGHA